MRHWDAVRFGLGMTQMAAATVAVVLLFFTGVRTSLLLAVVIASVLTTLSVLLFGATRHPRAPRSQNSSSSNR